MLYNTDDSKSKAIITKNQNQQKLAEYQQASIDQISQQYMMDVVVVVVVSVEAKLSFVEPGRRWAHSPSQVKPLVSLPGYYENLREDVKNLRRSLTAM